MRRYRCGLAYVPPSSCVRRLEFGPSTNLKARVCVRYATGFCKYGENCRCGGRVGIPDKQAIERLAEATPEDLDEQLDALSEMVDDQRWYPHGPTAIPVYQKARISWRTAPRKKQIRVTDVVGENAQPVPQPYKYYIALSLNGGVDGRWETWENGEREIMEMSAVLLKPVFDPEPGNIYTTYRDKNAPTPFRGLYEVDRFHEFVSPAYYRTKRFLRNREIEQTDAVQFCKDSLGRSFEDAMDEFRFWLLSHELYYPWDETLDRRKVNFALVVHDSSNFRQRIALQCRATETADMPVRRRKDVHFPKIFQEWVDVQDLYRASPLSNGDESEIPLEEMMERLQIDQYTPENDRIDRAESIAKVLISLWSYGVRARLSKRVRLDSDTERSETYTAPKT